MDQERTTLLKKIGFSDKAIEILENEVNMGKLENPTVTAEHQSICGDILMLSLKIEDGKIIDAGYEYIGCAGLQACASGITEIIKGMPVEEANKIEAEHIVNYLEGIPFNKVECAECARDTLRKALKNWT